MRSSSIRIDRERVTAPLHADETIGSKLLGSILHQAGLTIEEFLTVL